MMQRKTPLSASAGARTTGLEIYAALLKHCQPYISAGHWSSLSHSEAYCSLDRAKLLADLRAHFSVEDLKAAGIVVSGEGAQDLLNPVLENGSDILIPLRRPNDNRVFDILTEQGALSGRPAVVAVTDDKLSVSGVQDLRGTVVVATSMEDVAVLRSLGVSAAPVAGLETISGSALRELCRYYQLENNLESVAEFDSCDAGQITGPAGSNWMGESDPWQMVLLGWNLAQLDTTPPTALKAIEDHFIELRQYLNVSIHEITKWIVNTETVEGIKFSLKYGEINNIQKLLVRSMDECCHSFDPTGNSLERVFQKPADHLDASTQIGYVRRCGGDKETRKQAWRNFEESLEKRIVGPLLEEAERSEDPTQRALLSSLAALTKPLHYQISVVTEKLANNIDSVGVAKADPISKDQMQSLIALLSQQLEIAREISQWQRQNRITMGTNQAGTHRLRLPQA